MKLNEIKNMDCLKYLRSLPDNSVDLVVTDPPYNVSQKTNIKYKDLNVTKNFGDWDFGFDPAPVMAEIKRVLKPKGQIFVFCSTDQIPKYMDIFKEKWQFRNLLVWYKTNPAPRLSKTNFVFANEYIIYAINDPEVKPGQVTFNWQGHKEMHNTIITGALQGKERLRNKDGKATHPTQKPLSILKKLIEIGSNKEDVVLDCFMGVGSTAVACKELNRNFVGCELDIKYYQEGNKRIN
ncbi:site-specific DNA-methyltransferase [Candidatus Woesearchaeota archaeon]|nr:site-specific DNA-methyltransferase [Candidatus Woesearchaeota archaeon]